MQGQGKKGPASFAVIPHQFGGDMLGVRRTSAVAEPNRLFPPFVGIHQRIRRLSQFGGGIWPGGFA